MYTLFLQWFLHVFQICVTRVWSVCVYLNPLAKTICTLQLASSLPNNCLTAATLDVSHPCYSISYLRRMNLTERLNESALSNGLGKIFFMIRLGRQCIIYWNLQKMKTGGRNIWILNVLAMNTLYNDIIKWLNMTEFKMLEWIH